MTIDVWSRTQSLIGQLSSPSVPDEEYVVPSSAAVAAAGRAVSRLGDLGTAPPLRVCPDREGGLVFEWLEGRLFWVLEFHADGATRFVLLYPGRTMDSAFADEPGQWENFRNLLESRPKQ